MSDKQTAVDIAVLGTKVESLTTEVGNLRSDVADLKLALARYRGAWGLLVLLISAVGAALGIFWSTITGWFHPSGG